MIDGLLHKISNSIIIIKGDCYFMQIALLSRE